MSMTCVAAVRIRSIPTNNRLIANQRPEAPFDMPSGHWKGSSRASLLQNLETFRPYIFFHSIPGQKGATLILHGDCQLKSSYAVPSTRRPLSKDDSLLVKISVRCTISACVRGGECSLGHDRDRLPSHTGSVGEFSDTPKTAPR